MVCVKGVNCIAAAHKRKNIRNKIKHNQELNCLTR